VKKREEKAERKKTIDAKRLLRIKKDNTKMKKKLYETRN
jgi:hypothetical protein